MASHPAVIINASSGADDKEQARSGLVEIFRAHEVEASVWLARSGEEVLRLTRRAVLEDCQPVVAGGGDGTINAVASQLVGTNRPLGVLPLGTLNHFAKDLKIPLDLEQAARVCLEGR